MKISNSMERYIKCQLMEGIKDVSPRDEDMISFTLNLLISLRRLGGQEITYQIYLFFLKIMACLAVNCYFVKKKINLF